MNLHNLVRQSVQAVTADQPLTYYRATGKVQRDKETKNKVPSLYAGREVRGQVQSIGADSIVQTERITQGAVVRRCYLYADKTPEARPWAMWRPLGRAGDYLTDQYGTWWYVDAVLEDFSQEGWVSLQIVMQTTKPTVTIIEEAGDGDASS